MLPNFFNRYYRKIIIVLFVILVVAIPFALNYYKKAYAYTTFNSNDYRKNVKSDIERKTSVLAATTQTITDNTAGKINEPPKPALTKAPSTTTTNTPSPSPKLQIPTNTLKSSGQSWGIQSVSSMKITKDRICNQASEDFIRKWVGKAKELGANYIALETPYDNPACGDAVNYSKTWIGIIRENGMKVWHRHMPLAFEGIYDTPKSASTDFLAQISDYIRNNKTDFASGDIFTPIPEPQNGGISGVTHCAGGVCQFDNAGDFNQWLRSAMSQSHSAFSEIELGGSMKVGYFGFDGFVAWGDNNPDWNGILDDETVRQMGNITIDHYPELVGDTMENDLDELMGKYPNTPIVIGEWGTVTGGDVEKQVKESMSAAKRPNVIGFNYWHMGMGGNESLINDDFSNKIHFDEVQEFYIN